LEPKKGAEPPPLYPSREGMPPKRPEPDQQDLYLIHKTTEFRHRFRYSPYFLQSTSSKKEIEKYSDRLFHQQQQKQQPTPKLYDLLKGKTYPEELLCGPQKRPVSLVPKSTPIETDNINFEDLEKKESTYKEPEVMDQIDQPLEPEEEYEDDDEFQEYKGNLFDDDDEVGGSEGEGKEGSFLLPYSPVAHCFTVTCSLSSVLLFTFYSSLSNSGRPHTRACP